VCAAKWSISASEAPRYSELALYWGSRLAFPKEHLARYRLNSSPPLENLDFICALSSTKSVTSENRKARCMVPFSFPEGAWEKLDSSKPAPKYLFMFLVTVDNPHTARQPQHARMRSGVHYFTLSRTHYLESQLSFDSRFPKVIFVIKCTQALLK